MNPHITLLTLGVDDLERAVAFYRDGLGFSTKGIIGKEFENGAVAFFNLQAGLKLALWPRKSLSADSGLPLQAPSALESSSWWPSSSRARRELTYDWAPGISGPYPKPEQSCESRLELGVCIRSPDDRPDRDENDRRVPLGWPCESLRAEGSRGLRNSNESGGC